MGEQTLSWERQLLMSKAPLEGFPANLTLLKWLTYAILLTSKKPSKSELARFSTRIAEICVEAPSASHATLGPS